MNINVRQCLKNDMRIYWPHYEAKYQSFCGNDKAMIDSKLASMHFNAASIKSRLGSPDDFDIHFPEGYVNDDVTEFLEANFACFKIWISHCGLELKKELYAHTYRVGGMWFPVVIIDQVIKPYICCTKTVTVYRGCNKNELLSKTFNERQSWTTHFDTAKAFAFQHISGKLTLHDRVVLEAEVQVEDILWDKAGESEKVLKQGFTPISVKTRMTYQEYLSV
ncbi:hypothetical protein CGJ29_19975 [Vibrio parahaemolyticus]|uniref:hypothetical protein n=1 Tax=Vibrio parahaemolyticus TaxID=670 RepID=UPI00111D1AAD|nr:hypothetical protein [Vibrio parahaemolyticus]TOF05473.1 hypothetical protein CGJ29_19975 [Vibrio parahaemolyticus]